MRSTKRSKPTAALASTDELPLLINAVQDYAIFGLSPSGEIRSWNEGASRIMGYKADEVVGRNFSLFYGPEDLENRKPSQELEVAGREGRIEDEGWRIRKDGTRFWANTIITVLREGDGIVRGFVKVTRDLTRRRQAEEHVRQSEEVFRLLVASVKDYAIFLLDPEGNVATWNAGAQAIKGYTPQEIIGRHFSTFYPEQDKLAGKPAMELRVARAEGRFEEEGWRIRKDGSRFWANVVITAVHDERGQLRGFAKVTRDMTDRKRSEDAQLALIEQREARLQAEEDRRRAEASYRAAEEANQAKDDFLMTLSHELRTPMTAIMGWSRLLPTLPADDPVVPQALASIARSADLQAQLIDDVLDVSRIVSGKLHLNVQDVEVIRVLSSAVEAVRPSASAKNTAITTSFADNLGKIMADPTRFQQIVWNLLANAVKFTPNDGVVEISAQRRTSAIQITVKDNGEGIEPGFLPHIFEPFWQAETPQTRVHGGLGLGLSIVRYLTEAQGGTVTARSGGKGMGSVFTLTLPIATSSAPAAVSHSASHYGDGVQSITGRLSGVEIIVVDDDPESRSIVTATLRQAGALVTTVGSAPDALSELKKTKADLVLTDIAMPHFDGYQLAGRIREHRDFGEIKLIAFSAFPILEGSNRGAFDAYLNKPIDPFKLVDSIASVIGR